MVEFPFIDKEGKLYEAFPMIVLHLSDGEKIELDYFGSKSLSYIPTRFMAVSADSVIPLVKYLSKFKSEKEVVQIFISEIVGEMREYGKNIFSVNGSEFVNWDNVCKIDVQMKHYVYCYDKPIFVGNSKHVKSDEEARWVCLSKDFEMDDEMMTKEFFKKDDETNYDFLRFAELE